MPNPEDYRKALRLMKMAEKFNLPLLRLSIPMVRILVSALKNAIKVKPLPKLFVMSRLKNTHYLYCDW